MGAPRARAAKSRSRAVPTLPLAPTMTIRMTAQYPDPGRLDQLVAPSRLSGGPHG
jgi:hypothetical protein